MQTQLVLSQSSTARRPSVTPLPACRRPVSPTTGPDKTRAQVVIQTERYQSPARKHNPLVGAGAPLPSAHQASAATEPTAPRRATATRHRGDEVTARCHPLSRTVHALSLTGHSRWAAGRGPRAHSTETARLPARVRAADRWPALSALQLKKRTAPS